jgi:hypothetical protein
MINRRLIKYFFAICICILFAVYGCENQPNQPETEEVVQSDDFSDISGVSSADPFEIRIEKMLNMLQGHYVMVPITTTGDMTSINNFQLLMAYDSGALHLREAFPGQYLTDNNWQSFTYNFLPDTVDNRVFVELFGMADSTLMGKSLDAVAADSVTELVNLLFYVSSDRIYECMYLPIRFYWRDCNDNVLLHTNMDTLYLASRVFDGLYGNEITDPTTGWGGPPAGCEDSLPLLTFQPVIDFINGGIDLTCECEHYPGDINCNGVGYEIADAVAYTNYFISGFEAFNDHIECSIAYSDLNHNGITLEVADLVYLIRIIIGDAISNPPPLPDNEIIVECFTHNRVLYINYESTYDIGAIWLTFNLAGQIGTPVPGEGAQNMDLKFSIDDEYLRILIYNIGSERIPAGNQSLLQIPFEERLELSQAEAGEYQGRRLDVTRLILPYTCEFYPNDPNPFNGQTTISFATPAPADYSLVIYNSLGHTVYKYSGRAEAGVVEHDWQAVDEEGYPLPSGVYIYTLTVGGVSNTQAMVQIK